MRVCRELALPVLEAVVRKKGEKDESKGTREKHVGSFYISNGRSWHGLSCHSLPSSVLVEGSGFGDFWIHLGACDGAVTSETSARCSILVFLLLS